ncbi:hypothetical protein C8R44DRAFT_987046, partial [Mycena epipterygia]
MGLIYQPRGPPICGTCTRGISCDQPYLGQGGVFTRVMITPSCFPPHTAAVVLLGQLALCPLHSLPTSWSPRTASHTAAAVPAVPAPFGPPARHHVGTTRGHPLPFVRGQLVSAHALASVARELGCGRHSRRSRRPSAGPGLGAYVGQHEGHPTLSFGPSAVPLRRLVPAHRPFHLLAVPAVPAAPPRVPDLARMWGSMRGIPPSRLVPPLSRYAAWFPHTVPYTAAAVPAIPAAPPQVPALA